MRFKRILPLILLSAFVSVYFLQTAYSNDSVMPQKQDVGTIQAQSSVIGVASDNQETKPSCEETSDYNNLRTVDCYREYLVGLEKKIDEALQDIYLNKSSASGEEADKEIKNRIRAAQSGWEQYRENHCSFDYVSKARTHPPSHSLRMIRCQVFMAHARLDEIRKTYKNF